MLLIPIDSPEIFEVSTVSFPRFVLIAALVAGPLATQSGCASVVIGAGAAAGAAVAQERSIGAAIDDKGIQFRVNAELLRYDEKVFRRIDVKSVEGRVVLTGTVPRPEDRLEAARLAWTVETVKTVANELIVQDETSVVDFARDSWITTQLRARMLGDVEVLDINYTVETVNGIVYLMGIAQDVRELDRITRHARAIRGVQRVVSHVRLKTDPIRKS